MKKPGSAGSLRRSDLHRKDAAIVTDDFVLRTPARPGVSDDAVATAWALSRGIARRRYVNRAQADADGVVRSNGYPLQHPTLTGLPPATPWTVNLTDEDDRFWFVVFDLDAKTEDAFSEASEDFGTLVRILDGENVPHLDVRSSPDGGFHVWVPVDGLPLLLVKQLGQAAKNVLGTLDLAPISNARTGAVRPPLSPHARGGFSQVMAGDPAMLEPDSGAHVDVERFLRVVAAFRTLRPADQPEDEAPTGRLVAGYRPRRPLPAWGEQHMAVAGGGADPSHTGYLCLIAMARAGWSFQDVQQAAITAPGMEHYRTVRQVTGPRRRRRPEQAEQRLRAQWDAALAHVAQDSLRPAFRQDRDLSELETIVASVEGMLQAFRVSPGRWGTHERDLHDARILRAIAWLTLHTGSQDVAAPLRTIAELTGIPSTTVDRRLTALRTTGHLSRVRVATDAHAALYRLGTVWTDEQQFSTPGKHVGPLHNVITRPPGALFDDRAVLLTELDQDLEAGRHDVFTRAGLGPTARRTYEALRNADTTEQQLADRAGVPLPRLRTALRTLKRWRLILQHTSGWRRTKRDQRRRAALQFGTAGILERRQVAYAQEREQWAWWRDHLATQAGRAPSRRRDHSPGPTQVRFEFTDTRGGPETYPSYPQTPDRRGDHPTAWRIIRTIGLQTLRNTELAA